MDALAGPKPRDDKKRRPFASSEVSHAEVEALLAQVGLAPDSRYVSTGSTAAEVLQPLHRRRALVSSITDVEGPPLMRRMKFSAGRARALQRLVTWLYAVVHLLAGNFTDTLLRRGSIERRAVRLRQMFERMGGTAVKIGQQMAIRIDLVPYAYAFELSKLLDKVPPFPVGKAIEAIERTTGRPLAESFASFDPTPIGSASVACVFQGVLRTGERVAVKVRRPGIGVIFTADCRALDWAMNLLERLTILKPGFTRNLVTEFRNMLLEELDFVKEARYTELFSRGLYKAKIHDTRAPRVHFDLSGEDVLVMEFITGVFMTEIIAAVEQKDGRILALLDRLDIHPKRLARLLLRTNHFSMFENLLFHADPHPANIIVRPGGQLVLIDFGSCGTYTWKERYIWRQLAHAHLRQDVAQMVQAALALIEPLPPIDIDEFTKRVEEVFWQDLLAFKSKHSEWWERTSARIWISFLELSREYQIPMNLNMLRMIRSTLLYETVAARLWHRVSSYREHDKYNRAAGKRARKRLHREMRRTLVKGVDERTWLRVEQLREMGNRAIYLMQRFVDAPAFRFPMLVGKAVYTISQLVRALLWLTCATWAVGVVLVIYHWLYLNQPGYDIFAALRELVSNRLWQAYSGITFFFMTRRVLFRMLEPEVDRSRRN